MKRIKTLEYASAGAFIAGFFACSTDSIAIAAAAAALMGLGAWGFHNRSIADGHWIFCRCAHQEHSMFLNHDRCGHFKKEKGAMTCT